MDSENDHIYLVIRATDISADRIESAVGVKPVCTQTGGLAFFRISLAESDDPSTTTGELIDWCDFIFTKSDELKQLSDLGCTTYLECALTSRDMYIDTEVMEKLATMNIGISVWFKVNEPIEETEQTEEEHHHQLVIPAPISWYSRADKNAFFHGLSTVIAVKSFRVVPGQPAFGECHQLLLFMKDPAMHEYSLRNLIGLMYRYSLDLTSLAGQCTTDNEHWFKDPSKYWYQAVFGTD